jgi:hypothetical protein
VRRRFRHFVWLHDQLCARYPFVLMPTMADKQVQGRFEQAFLERRRRQLERYLQRLAAHPLLRSSAVLLRFLRDPTDPVRGGARGPPPLACGACSRKVALIHCDGAQEPVRKAADATVGAEADRTFSYLDRVQIPPSVLVSSACVRARPAPARQSASDRGGVCVGGWVGMRHTAPFMRRWGAFSCLRALWPSTYTASKGPPTDAKSGTWVRREGGSHKAHVRCWRQRLRRGGRRRGAAQTCRARWADWHWRGSV